MSERLRMVSLEIPEGDGPKVQSAYTKFIVNLIIMLKYVPGPPARPQLVKILSTQPTCVLTNVGGRSGLVEDVRVAGRVVADQNHAEVRPAVSGQHPFFHVGPRLVPDLASQLLS